MVQFLSPDNKSQLLAAVFSHSENVDSSENWVEID